MSGLLASCDPEAAAKGGNLGCVPPDSGLPFLQRIADAVMFPFHVGWPALAFWGVVALVVADRVLARRRAAAAEPETDGAADTTDTAAPAEPELDGPTSTPDAGSVPVSQEATP